MGFGLLPGTAKTPSVGLERIHLAEAVDPLQGVGAAVPEPEPGPLEQVACRSRDTDLARRGECRDPRCRVDGDAARIASGDGYLARVEARPDLDAQRAHRLGHRPCAPDATTGTVEQGQEAIAGGYDLPTAEPVERGPQPLVV